VVGLVASLVLTTKASDDPTYDGQAAVHGHPKVAAGSGRQKPIAKILMSSKTDSEELTMPPVITEDNAKMQTEELTNVPESNEAMIEEVSELSEKAGIVGKLITAKQNLIDHDGEVTSRDPQRIENLFSRVVINFRMCPCQCDEEIFDEFGRGNCNSQDEGEFWCFLAISENGRSFCPDQRPSNKLEGQFWSRRACSLREEMRQFQEL